MGAVNNDNVKPMGFVVCPLCGGTGRVDTSSFTIGDRFRIARGNRRQAEVAAELGINRTTLSNIESGRNDPTITTLQRAARVFGCTVDQLLGQ